MSDEIRKIHQLKVDNVTSILSALSDIIFIIDSKGCFLDYYSSDPSRFLVDEKNIIGSSIYDLFPKEEADYHVSFFNDTMKTGKINSFEYSADNNGIKKFFEARVSKLDDSSVLSIVRDITEKTNALNALAESEQKFRKIADFLPEAVFETDSNLIVTYANKKTFDMFGHSIEDLKKGIMVLDLISEDDVDRGKDNIALRFSDSLKFLSKYTGIRKDKTRFPISMHSSPVFLDGKPAGIRGVILDVSYQEKINEAMSRNQRLESLGFLAGGIAHDFNNLILGLFGSIENAKNELKKNNIQDAVTTLNHSLSAFERARGLTHQLLTFSKGGKPIKKVGNVIRTLKDAINFAFSGKNIIPEVNFENEVVACNYDDSQISQVIDNILINAIQACLENGRISIQTKQKFLGKNNETLLNPGKYLSIILKDNGKGFDKDIISKIFDPFFTTKEKGNGLGLAISWSIVKNHGGTICVRSDKNGTAFEVLLPLSNENIPLEDKKDAVRNPGNLKVMVMDDEFLIREVAGKILTDYGFTVEKAENGNEALEKYQAAMNDNKKFDVVILDLTIPGGMGGVETLKELKEIDPQVNAIASSGFSEDSVISNPESFGFTTSIPKPYLKEKLFAVVSESIVKLKDQSS